MSKCQECTLDYSNRIVSSGSIYAPIMLVGEAPGAEEEKKGEPFVGKAGKILRSVLGYLELGSDDVYMTNLVMCRPPENRDPSKEEINNCRERLESEIKEVSPTVIVTLGKIPGESILGGKLKTHRGRVIDMEEYKGIMTYHPAAVLYGKGDTLFPYILDDIRKAKNIVYGNYQEIAENSDTSAFIVDTVDKMETLLERLKSLEDGTIVSFDWETTGLSHLWDCGFCFGLSWKEQTGVAVSMDLVRLYSENINEQLKRFKLVGYNSLLFDGKWNEKYGLCSDTFLDAQLYHALMDERPQARSLTNLAHQYLAAPDYEGEMLAEYGTDKKKFIEEVPPEVIYEYCARDVDWTLRLSNFFLGNTSTEYMEVFLNHIKPAATAFADIMENGFWIDRDKLSEISLELNETLRYHEDRMKQISGKEDFNPRSPQQIGRYLWDELNLEQPDLYNRDDRSVDKPTVAALIEAYPDVPFLRELYDYRENFTLYSRYVRDLPEYVDPDGRVRCDYHFDRTETGRLSTSNPSIHQIPRESSIRSIFSTPPNYSLIQADYEQIEMRMAAYIAQDDNLAEMLSNGRDFHSLMASRAYRIPYEEVTDDLRQAAKGVSFGLLYLMSDKGLVAQTGLPRDEAVNFVKEYKDSMPKVQSWMEDIKAQIRNKQYIVSPFGRYRRFPLLLDSNINGLFREGVNFPIQSGASDLTLTSVVRVHNYLKNYYPEAKVVAMVHDSLIAEAPDYIAQEVADEIKQIMESPSLETNVSFPVEIKIGRRWGE